MADFNTAYRIVHGNEGGYANVAGDKGGETYRGIARVSHPQWAGWATIDAIKRVRAIRHNVQINDAALNELVMQFYRGTWNKMYGDGIRSQALANLYYDFYTNSGGATRVLQRVLVYQFGQPITIDGAPGPRTLAAINACEPAALHNALKQARIAYVKALAERDPSQQKFLAPWLNRIQAFPDQEKKTSDSPSPSPASRPGGRFASLGKTVLSKLRNPFSRPSTDEKATA